MITHFPHIYSYKLKLSRIPGGWNGQMSKLEYNKWIKALIQDLDIAVPNNSIELKLTANDSNPYIADRFLQIISEKVLDIKVFSNHSKFEFVEAPRKIKLV